MKRRQVLTALGTAALATGAGCATIQAELGTTKQTLGEVALRNTESTAVTVELEVLRNSETVYAASHDLSPVSSSNTEPLVVHEWAEEAEARRWTVRARTADSDWHDATLDAARGANCHNVLVETGNWSETSLLVLPRQCGSNPSY